MCVVVSVVVVVVEVAHVSAQQVGGDLLVTILTGKNLNVNKMKKKTLFYQMCPK